MRLYSEIFPGHISRDLVTHSTVNKVLSHGISCGNLVQYFLWRWTRKMTDSPMIIRAQTRTVTSQSENDDWASRSNWSFLDSRISNFCEVDTPYPIEGTVTGLSNSCQCSFERLAEHSPQIYLLKDRTKATVAIRLVT